MSRKALFVVLLVMSTNDISCAEEVPSSKQHRLFYSYYDDGGEHPVTACESKTDLPGKLKKGKILGKADGYIGSEQTEFAKDNEASINAWEHYFSSRTDCEKALKKVNDQYEPFCKDTLAVPAESPEGKQIADAIRNHRQGNSAVQPSPSKSLAFQTIQGLDGWFMAEVEGEGVEPGIELLRAEKEGYRFVANWGGQSEFPDDINQNFMKTAPNVPVKLIWCFSAGLLPSAPFSPLARLEGEGLLGQLFAAASPDLDEKLSSLASSLETQVKAPHGDRKHAREFNDRALTELQGGQAVAAAETLIAASVADPGDAEIASNLGYALIEAQQPSVAYAPLIRSVLLQPKRSSAWGTLGEALARDGKTEKAIAAFKLTCAFSRDKEKTLAFFKKFIAEKTDAKLTAAAEAGLKSCQFSASAPPVAGAGQAGVPPLPTINNLPIGQAREKLLAAGWMPIVWVNTQMVNGQNCANGSEFFDQGYFEFGNYHDAGDGADEEADSGSPTRDLRCTFHYADIYGRTLTFDSQGLENHKQGKKAVVVPRTTQVVDKGKEVCRPVKHAEVPAASGLYGVSYDKARARLMASGWKPHATKRSSGMILGPMKAYPEVSDCSGTGWGFCLAEFTDPFDNHLTILTAGDYNGVTGVSFRCRPK